MPLNKLTLIFCLVILFTRSEVVDSVDFHCPTAKYLQAVPITDVARALKSRHVDLKYQKFLTNVSKTEKEGFLGYHGNSLDFLIYQDIIRYIIELKLNIPIREDFHLLAVPLDPLLTIQTRDELADVFMHDSNAVHVLQETTFPLNFGIWDNATRFGLNSVEQFTKNEPVKPKGYHVRLQWFFNRLGMDLAEIDSLFILAHSNLRTESGVLLQIFDQSTVPYAFSKKWAYPSYPSGFITENRTIDEYFYDEPRNDQFPHEVRLLLNNHRILNPANPLKIIRHVDEISSKQLNEYKSALKNRIDKLSYNKKNASIYKSELQHAWVE